jgi:HSP20 family protein
MTLPVLRSSGRMGRWDPFREFTDLQQRMNELMRSAFEGFGDVTEGWRPLADLSETEDAYVVEMDLPGVKKEDISIELLGNELVVSGEYKQTEKTGWLRSKTRRTGRFEYRTLLPQNVEQDKITAQLADGVLTVTVPKAESMKPRRIEITAK